MCQSHQESKAADFYRNIAGRNSARGKERDIPQSAERSNYLHTNGNNGNQAVVKIPCRQIPRNRDSCRELTREIIEEYLIYLKTEATETKHYHADLNRLRSLLECTGKMCGYENLAGLFLSRDVPPTPKAKFTVRKSPSQN